MLTATSPQETNCVILFLVCLSFSKTCRIKLLSCYDENLLLLVVFLLIFLFFLFSFFSFFVQPNMILVCDCPGRKRQVISFVLLSSSPPPHPLPLSLPSSSSWWRWWWGRWGQCSIRVSTCIWLCLPVCVSHCKGTQYTTSLHVIINIFQRRKAFSPRSLRDMEDR